MAYVSTNEVAQIKRDLERFFGASAGIGFDGVVKEIPSNATADTDRSTIVASLACSDIQPLDGKERERADMATVAKPFVCKAVYNASVLEGHRLTAGSSEYRIHHVVPSPENDPLYMILYLEDDDG